MNPATAPANPTGELSEVLIPVRYGRSRLAGIYCYFFIFFREDLQTATAKIQNRTLRPDQLKAKRIIGVAWALLVGGPTLILIARPIVVAAMQTGFSETVYNVAWLIAFIGAPWFLEFLGKYILTWLILFLFYCLAVLVVLPIVVLTFLAVLVLRREQIKQLNKKLIRVCRIGEQVVVGSEKCSLFLRPSAYRLVTLGGSLLICKSITSRQAKVVALIPKNAIPAEWVSKLTQQLQPKPASATAAA